jgi:hypothetical protein
MPPAGFEPTILASERPKTHALNRRPDVASVVFIRLLQREIAQWNTN